MRYFSLRILLHFYFLWAVVNVPIQTPIFSPWRLLRKMIILLLELGPPVVSQAGSSCLLSWQGCFMNIYLTYQVVHGRVLAACLLKNSKILKIVNLLLTSILFRDVMKLVTRKLHFKSLKATRPKKTVTLYLLMIQTSARLEEPITKINHLCISVRFRNT